MTTEICWTKHKKEELEWRWPLCRGGRMWGLTKAAYTSLPVWDFPTEFMEGSWASSGCGLFFRSLGLNEIGSETDFQEQAELTKCFWRLANLFWKMGRICIKWVNWECFHAWGACEGGDLSTLDRKVQFHLTGGPRHSSCVTECGRLHMALQKNRCCRLLT